MSITTNWLTDWGAKGYKENFPITVSAYISYLKPKLLLHNSPDNVKLDCSKEKRSSAFPQDSLVKTNCYSNLGTIHSTSFLQIHRLYHYCIDEEYQTLYEQEYQVENQKKNHTI